MVQPEPFAPPTPPEAVLSDYNIAYARRRFLKPMVDDAQLREMLELERVCFPPPENYDLRTLKMFVSLNGVGLLRRYEVVDSGPKLIAFHLFDCLSAELITLDVHPDFRRKGIGKGLLEMSLTKLREIGHEQATCQIATGNTASIDLHVAFGFRKVGRLRNYYGPGRHAYLMNARLIG
jgi:[ribosomal protein S18]-alanine N-acetyltransferase